MIDLDASLTNITSKSHLPCLKYNQDDQKRPNSRVIDKNDFSFLLTQQPAPTHRSTGIAIRRVLCTPMSTKESSHTFIHMNDKYLTSPRLPGWCIAHTLVRLPRGPVSMSIHMCVSQSEVPHLSLTKEHLELLRTCCVCPWVHGPTALSTRESNKSTKNASGPQNERSDQCAWV